jgi:hypothetical protein
MLGAAIALSVITAGGARAAGQHRPAALSTSGSIVFQHGGNIFVARPDGSHLKQVTHGATAANGYDSPTQTDSGQIVAVKNMTTIVKMDRNGKQIGKALKVASGLTNSGALHNLAFGPDVSPDGKRVAVSLSLLEGQYDPSTGIKGMVLQAETIDYFQFSPARRIHQMELAGTNLQSPYWVNNNQLIVFAPYNIAAPEVYTASPSGNDHDWFADTIDGDGILDRQQLDKGELTRNGKLLADIRGTNLTQDWRGASIEVYSVSNLSTDPTPLCSLAAQHGAFGKVTWSPDGSTLAWSDSNGIWESAIDPTASNCGFAPKLVFKGARNPDWGPTGVS